MTSLSKKHHFVQNYQQVTFSTSGKYLVGQTKKTIPLDFDLCRGCIASSLYALMHWKELLTKLWSLALVILLTPFIVFDSVQDPP